MLTAYYTTSINFSSGSGLRIRRLGVRVLLGVFVLLRNSFLALAVRPKLSLIAK